MWDHLSDNEYQHARYRADAGIERRWGHGRISFRPHPTDEERARWAGLCRGTRFKILEQHADWVRKRKEERDGNGTSV